jgi:hypothetical protein
VHPVTQHLGRVKQEGLKFEASLETLPSKERKEKREREREEDRQTVIKFLKEVSG